MNPGDDLDLFPVEDGATPLTPEEQLELIPSLATRAQLNEVERLGINTARVEVNSVRILTFSSRVAAAYRCRNASTSSRRAGAVIEALMNHLHFVSPPEVVPVGNINYEATPLLR